MVGGDGFECIEKLNSYRRKEYRFILFYWFLSLDVNWVSLSTSINPVVIYCRLRDRHRRRWEETHIYIYRDGPRRRPSPPLPFSTAPSLISSLSLPFRSYFPSRPYVLDETLRWSSLSHLRGRRQKTEKTPDPGFTGKRDRWRDGRAGRVARERVEGKSREPSRV